MGLNDRAGFQPLGGINVFPGALPQAGIVCAIGASKNNSDATISYTNGAPKNNLDTMISYTNGAPKNNLDTMISCTNGAPKNNLDLAIDCTFGAPKNSAKGALYPSPGHRPGNRENIPNQG